MDKILIRHGKKEDASWISQMDQQFIDELRQEGVDGIQDHCFTQEIIEKDSFKNNYFKILIAELNNKKTGYIIYHWGYETSCAKPGVELVDIYVPKEYRKIGIAREMVLELQNICKSNNGTWIKWRYDAPNKNAIRFYESLGADLPNDERLGYLNLRGSK